MPLDKNREILTRLGEWKAREGSLPQSLQLYSQLLENQTALEAALPAPALNLTADEAKELLRQRKPLLGITSAIQDWDAFQKHYRSIVDILAIHLEPEGQDIQGLKTLSENQPLLKQVTNDWFSEIPLGSIAIEECVTEELLSASIQAAARPFLSNQATALIKLVDQELWRRRVCPVCSGKPDLAYLDAERGARWLLCSRCDSEWLYQRLECPHCGTQDQKMLAYMTDESEVYRLYTCDSCHAYIKAIDLRKAEAGVLLPLERIMTLDMDRQAVESGYHPG